MQPIVIPVAPQDLQERDPNCELCRHQWFSAHLHTDGTGRCFSRDAHTIYIQDFESFPHCSCPNGIHATEGSLPKCWHWAQYLQLREERRLLASALLERGKRLTLQDIYE